MIFHSFIMAYGHYYFFVSKLVTSTTSTTHAMLTLHFLYLFLIPDRMCIKTSGMETRELIYKRQVVQEKENLLEHLWEEYSWKILSYKNRTKEVVSSDINEQGKVWLEFYIFTRADNIFQKSLEIGFRCSWWLGNLLRKDI